MKDKIVVPKEIDKSSQDLSAKAVASLDSTKSIIIVDDAGYQEAATLLKSFKTQTKNLADKQKELTRPINDAKTGIINFFKAPIDKLKEATKAVNDAMIAYHAKVEAARKKEEKRLADIAEKERKYQEGLAEKRLKNAKKNGDEERIEEVEDQIEDIQTQTVAPVVAANKPVAAGVHTRETWSGEVTDKMALIKAVAAGQAPETLLDVNIPTLNQMARSMKKFLSYPGVKAVSKSTIASR